MPSHVFDRLPSRRPQGSFNRRTIEFHNNETASVIPTLRKLITRDPQVSTAYLCHPSARHVFGTSDESNFCGYQNIRMALQFVRSAKSKHDKRLYSAGISISELQRYIEAEWLKDLRRREPKFTESRQTFNGQIHGSRKWIGTSEAQAVYDHFDIPSKQQDSWGNYGWLDLLDYVERYFAFDRHKGVKSTSHGGQIFSTTMAPIYFQFDGHSITIIGIQTTVDGERDLLVFDPARPTSKIMKQYIQSGTRVKMAYLEALEPYKFHQSRLKQKSDRNEGFALLM
jgi:hypothetical protein